MSYPNQPINVYTCTKCTGHIVTIDRETGVTPVMVRCRATEGCGAMMHSAFYSVKAGLTPAWEWRKPTPEEYKKLDYATRIDHVDRGGLLLYSIGKSQKVKPVKVEPAQPKGNRAKARRMRNRARSNQ
jgi:hypothetical protein